MGESPVLLEHPLVERAAGAFKTGEPPVLLAMGEPPVLLDTMEYASLPVFDTPGSISRRRVSRAGARPVISSWYFVNSACGRTSETARAILIVMLCIVPKTAYGQNLLFAKKKLPFDQISCRRR